MAASVARVALFLSRSSTMPSWSRFAQIASRSSARFSPMPAVIAIASAAAIGDSVADTRDARAAAEVTGDDAQVGTAHGRLAVVQIEVRGAAGDIVPAQELSAAFGDELVARPVKSPAAHADVMPPLGHR